VLHKVAHQPACEWRRIRPARSRSRCGREVGRRTCSWISRSEADAGFSVKGYPRTNAPPPGQKSSVPILQRSSIVIRPDESRIATSLMRK
jgi:hypothetical protein